jgi:hypothetical protein
MAQRIKSCPKCHTISKIADTHPDCGFCGSPLFSKSIITRVIDSRNRRECKEKKTNELYHKLLSGEISID